jgi:hypothetical protein
MAGLKSENNHFGFIGTNVDFQGQSDDDDLII